MALSGAYEIQMNEMIARMRHLETELAETKTALADKHCPHRSCHAYPPDAAAARACAIANGLLAPNELFGPAYSPYSPGSSPRCTPIAKNARDQSRDRGETPDLGNIFGD